MVSLTLQSIEFAKVNVDVQPRNQHYDSESDGGFHSRERNREQNQHLTSDYRRGSPHPAPQLSGPGKAAALVKDPAVPRRSDTKSAMSSESLFSSSGGSPSWGPTSITVNNIRTTTAPIYTAIWNAPMYEASRRKNSPAMPRNEIPRAAAP